MDNKVYIEIMSKRAARRAIAKIKPGCTVKEFLYWCEDQGAWFDIIFDMHYEPIYYALTR